jgi:hypothetical protein
MRWDDLFADLEARLDAAAAVERGDEVAERTRAERARVRLIDRIRAHEGEVELALADGVTLSGFVRDAGATWVLLADGQREHLVVLASLAVATGLTDHAAPAAGPVLSGLGLGQALRAVAADRAVVRARVGQVELLGRVDAVGSDHLDLAEVIPETRRPTGRRRAIAFASLSVLTST